MTAGRLITDGGMISDRPPAGHAGGDPLGALVPLAGAAVAVALAGCGVTLLARRLGGGFAVAPSPLLTWGVVTAGLGLMIASDRLAAPGDWRARVPARGGLLAAAAATLPLGGGLATLGGLAAVAVAAVAAAWPLLPSTRSRGRPRVSPERPAAATLADQPGTSPRPAADLLAADLPGPPVGPAEPVEGLRQRLERFVTAAGHDWLRGRLLVPVAAGSRLGHAHIGFCPAFAVTPAVEVATACDLVEAELAAAEILPWGVRVECRLSEQAEEPLAIPVDILVRTDTPPAAS